MADELTTGDFIRSKREGHGISRRALSIAAGLSGSYISKVEAGEIEPSFRAVAKIARELRFTSAEIVFLVQQEGVRP